MGIVDSLLNSLQLDAPVRQVVVGAFWTAVVLDTDPPRCGLAAALRDNMPHGSSYVQEAGRLEERSGRELARLLHSDRILEASIGMAAFNALLEVDEQPLVEANAEEIIIEKGRNRRLAIVGHFPFVPRVRRAVPACCVLELEPRPGDLPASEAVRVVPEADVIAITGSSIINHTFDGLMGLRKPEAFVLLLGPSAPMTPVLFEAGVNAISGTVVDDPGTVLRSVSQGATFRQVKRGGGLRLLTWFA